MLKRGQKVKINIFPGLSFSSGNLIEFPYQSEKIIPSVLEIHHLNNLVARLIPATATIIPMIKINFS